MGSKLTFNIRCESVDDVAEIVEKFTEAALVAENPFSFDPEQKKAVGIRNSS